MTKAKAKESFWFPTLYKGEKKSKWPMNVCNVEKLSRGDFYIRSRQNLQHLEELYGIDWVEFFRYRFIPPTTHCGYVAHGLFGRHKVTYFVYKHSGYNMGDVFFYFGNGNRLLLTMVKKLEKYPIPTNGTKKEYPWIYSYNKNFDKWRQIVFRRLFHPRSTLGTGPKTKLAIKLLDTLEDTRKTTLLKNYLLKGQMYG